MNIASFTHYTSLYGANRSLLALIDGSKAREVSFHVFTPSEGAITGALEDRNIPYHIAPSAWWMTKHRSRRRALRHVRQIVAALPSTLKKLKEWEIDLIHTNSSVIPIGACAAEALRCPHVWHIREFGDLDYNLSLDWPEWFVRFIMGRSTTRVAVSHAVGAHVCGSRGLSHQVVYNGVFPECDLDKLRSCVNQRDQTPFTFAIVGLLHEAKGQRQALKAIQRLKEGSHNVRLLIAGSGADEEHLKDLTETLGVQREVDFLGFVDDPFDVYTNAHAVLMCSPNEAMGRVTAEAMMAKRPVIGHDSQGTKEVVDHGETGLLYDGTVEDLASKMRRFVQNPDLGQVLGQQAFEKAKSLYTNEAYARRVNEIFRSASER